MLTKEAKSKQASITSFGPDDRQIYQLLKVVSSGVSLKAAALLFHPL
jgi:hypothetical protein